MVETSRGEPRSVDSGAPHEGDLLPAGRQGRGKIAGTASGLVVAAGFVWSANIPGGGTTSTSSILDYYHSSGKRATGIIGALLLVAGCLLIMWFFTELRSRLADTTRARVAHTFAITGAALIIAGAGITIGPTGAQDFSRRPFVGTAVADALAQAGMIVLIFGVLTVAAAIFLFGLTALRENACLPR